MDYNLKSENSLLLKIIDSSYDGIFITDADGMILYFNEAYLRISGLKKEKIEGRSIQDLIASGEIPDACSPEVSRTRKTVTKIIDYYHGVSALVTSTPILDEQRRLIRIFSNVRDITDLMRLKEQLKNTEELKNEYLRQLREFQQEVQGSQHFLVDSAVMKNILRLALRISQVASPVLIQGESGVGKDMLARYIHDAGEGSSSRPFIQVNCSAIPETLLESELFGYEPGAFTGASKKGKTGLFELANNGTLFLDEIGEMPFTIQVKLLNVLQTNQVYRLGGTKIVQINTRIIAATNSNLEKLVETSRFRRDLYYRLNVIPIYIPPLRERKEDIVPLILNFVDIKNREFNVKKKIAPKTVEILSEYSWPGNVRELKNVVERMVVLAEGDVIDDTCIPGYIKNTDDKKYFIEAPGNVNSFDLRTILAEVERGVIKKALTVFGSMRKAAVHLGIDLSTLVRKKKKYDI